MRRLLYAAAAAAVAATLSLPAWAATNVCGGGITTITAVSHQWLTSLGTNCTFAQSQPAVGDLANVAGGTVLANATGSSAAPTATINPVLGIAGTSTGTLGLTNSAGGTLTLSTNGAVTNYTISFPGAAPASNGQALTATTAGAASWTSVLTTQLTVSSKTTSYNATSALDWTRFDNTGAGGSVVATLPAAPSAGDNWCFLVTAAQTHEVLANTGETINFGGTVSASAGNIQSNTVGSSACLYFATATAAYVYASTGPWAVN